MSNSEIIAVRDFIEAIGEQGLDNPFPMLSVRLHTFGNTVDIREFLSANDSGSRSHPMVNEGKSPKAVSPLVKKFSTNSSIIAGITNFKSIPYSSPLKKGKEQTFDEKWSLEIATIK